MISSSDGPIWVRNPTADDPSLSKRGVALSPARMKLARLVALDERDLIDLRLEIHGQSDTERYL